MKKLLLASVALIALASSASAADLAARPYTKAPVAPISPAYNWSGFYIGAMGGYGWSSDVTTNGVTVSSSDLKGGFAGGTIGYNWQFSPSWVFGLEADAAWADLSASDTVLGITLEDKIRSMGSVTGRLGYAAGPALLYVKGGWAWANNRVSVSGFGQSVSDSQFHSGWTVGAGLEYMFAPSWSAKAEYMYADYGKETYFNALDLGTSVHTIKGGINYHFNWGGPVVAKY
ncbi:outer membrane protein [Bradyrhizobium prioriisuperbiae]|uniref:outer membrane protein n=1 Tax=Bradyrhizobium prioriisuperbiae TaxID=2854389 RepID=UPI0028EAAE10|nr:outer membrane beta-barrel protein [Bradyrhizobium prioritasuperba]